MSPYWIGVLVGMFGGVTGTWLGIGFVKWRAEPHKGDPHG